MAVNRRDTLHLTTVTCHRKRDNTHYCSNCSTWGRTTGHRDKETDETKLRTEQKEAIEAAAMEAEMDVFRRQKAEAAKREEEKKMARRQQERSSIAMPGKSNFKRKFF